MKRARTYITTLVLLAFVPVLRAENTLCMVQDSISNHQSKVIFAGIKTFDRGINRNRFVYKGEYVMGVMATHADVSGGNADVLLLLSDLNASASLTLINPYLGYTYRDNQVAGVRFGYNTLRGTINEGTIDLGASNGMSFDVPYINYRSTYRNYGLFHRSYAALDEAGRFALFADMDLGYTTNKTVFEMGGEGSSTVSHGWGLELNFNPGIAVYIFPNVSTTLSFGLGGIGYSGATQYDGDGAFIGEKNGSSLSFKLNLLAINIGVNIHLWGKN